MDKRNHKRVQFDRNILVNTAYGNNMTLKAFDYSDTGIGLEGLISEAVPRIGDNLQLQFSVGSNGIEQDLSLKGKVKYIELKAYSYTIGVGFSTRKAA